MRVILIHNYYQQAGGEDDVFEQERDLLRSRGHQVAAYVRRNDEIGRYGWPQKLTLIARTTWAGDSRAELRRMLAEEKPDLAHVHNTFPLISPAVYGACQEAGVPVVQTLHNARWLCPGSNYYRDRRVCKDCLGKSVPWPGAWHGCYRDSRAASSVVTAMLAVHNLLGTFRENVDMYILPTEFYRGLFAEAGYAPERLRVKPHFVPEDPGVGQGSGEYALFIGRLSEQKGADVLAAAWRELGVPLKVRGDGPLLHLMEDCARRNAAVELLPRLEKREYQELIRGARFLVWPSAAYYEVFGRVAIEAFAAGVPVVSADMGAHAELVEDGRTGIHFRSGDAGDLAAKVRWAWEHADEMARMGERARLEYERKYTPDINHAMLMDIYTDTLARRGVAVRNAEGQIAALAAHAGAEKVGHGKS